MCLGIILSVRMANGKNGMSFALKLLRPALSLGGVVAAGRLRGFSKPPSTVLVYTVLVNRL